MFINSFWCIIMTHPFIKCLHPKVITNRYTHEKIIVKCGKCASCLNGKSLQMTRKCQIESLSHNYTYFVTLTYDRFNVPLGRFTFNKHNNLYDFNCINHRITKDLGTSYICSFTSDEVKDMVDIRGKIHPSCKGNIPFLYKRDVQLFLKRLRKRINNEKIRYFLCGEYGTERYRSHYHLLVWFEDERTAKSLRKNIRKSWTFGRVDVQSAREKSASYVASYVTGLSNLPSFYKNPCIRPFNVHSWRLAESICKDVYKNKPIEQADNTRINEIIIPINDKYTNIILWRSLETLLYPRCKGYVNKSDEFKLFTYRAYEKILDRYGETSAFRQARFLVHILSNYSTSDYSLFDLKSNSDISDIIYYFHSNTENAKNLFSCMHAASTTNTIEACERYLNLCDCVCYSIYRELYSSKLFYDLQKRNNWTSFQTLDYINYYYDELNKQRYIQDIFTFNEFCDKYKLEYNTDALANYLYPDTFNESDFISEQFYRIYRDDSKRINENKTKYKKLNDVIDIIKF